MPPIFVKFDKLDEDPNDNIKLTWPLDRKIAHALSKLSEDGIFANQE